MRFLSAMVVLLMAGPAWGQASRAMLFQETIAATVFTAAFAFVAPRALDPVTVQQLALWGLAAPASMDESLSTEIRDGAVVLLKSGTVVSSYKLPEDDSPQAWGALVASILDAAARASPQMADGGMQAVINAFFDEMFGHLDPYSRYVPPEDAGADRARRSGEAGAGIQLRAVGKGFVLSDVNADGAAAASGAKVGDRLLAVDDQPVAGEDIETVKGWIAGLEGTDLSLTLRGRRGPARVLEMERTVTPPETVFASRTGPILLIRISAFSRDTDARLARELDRWIGGPASAAIKGLVVDMRGNRGGLLRQAVSATDMLVDGGVIATTSGRNPLAIHEYKGAKGDLAGGRPVVILVDGRSASAAEIMAAALADGGRAVVVGSDTLGKGLVQTIATLPDGGELFVSWSRVLAPGGWPLQGLGVMPQVCTSLGPDALAQQLDALDHGTQPLAAALARHHAARAPLPPAEVIALRNACPASEARDLDMGAARYLVAHPAAYATARIAPP